MQQIFFIHFLNSLFFKKSAYMLLVFFNWVPYKQISESDMIPGVNIISKSECSKCSKVNVASVNVAGTPVGVLGGGAP